MSTDEKFLTQINKGVTKQKQSMSTAVASINTRDITYCHTCDESYPPIKIPEEFRIDTSPFISRPFFVESAKWSNETQYTILSLSTRQLPRSVILSNKSLENAVKLGAYYRSDMSLNISVSGTISHAGTLLAAVVPPLNTFSFDAIYNQLSINTLLSGPHAFLNANEATSVVLHVPWFCNTDLASLDFRNEGDTILNASEIVQLPGNFASLIIMVLNPLQVATGSNTVLDIVIEATFNALDIFVPSPKYITYSSTVPTFSSQGLATIASKVIDASTAFIKSTAMDAIDAARAGIRSYTGLHNDNNPNILNRNLVVHRNFPNNTDGPQFFEKLDPYFSNDRIIQRPEFNTYTDEMSIDHIISKKQYLGTFRASALDNVGSLLWSRPISPFQGGANPIGNLPNLPIVIANNIELMHFLTRGWSGTINIHIQSVMNNKQQIKLRLLQLYNPNIQIATKFPTYRSILNAPSHLLEFTGGGQFQTVSMPFLCRNHIAPNFRDNISASLFIGEYYIFTAQPLANASGSPLDVYFNVYMSLGDDFKFFDYSTELGTIRGPFTVSVPPTIYEEEESSFTSEGLAVMNEPQSQKEILSFRDSINKDTTNEERLYSPVSIRSFIRRMYRLFKTSINTRELYPFPLALVSGEIITNGAVISPLQMIAGMYYGKHIGFKIKIKAQTSELGIFYAPPQPFIQNSGLIKRTSINTSSTRYVSNNPDSNYPMPFIEMPNVSNITSDLYEFIIPNKTLYKYVGSPSKMTYNLTLSSLSNESTSDSGNVIIVNNAAETEVIEIFAGASDESRFGFHCIAPVIQPISTASNIITTYNGNFETNSIDPPVSPLNNFLYYTRT